MIDENTPTARPVSLVAVIAIFALLSLFGLMARRFYVREISPAPQNEMAEHLSKDLAWRNTPESRRAYLADLRKKQSAQAESYGWVDQKTGVVQLPISRAMELIVQEHAAK